MNVTRRIAIEEQTNRTMRAVMNGEVPRYERARHLAPFTAVHQTSARLTSAPKIQRVRLVTDPEDVLDTSPIEREFPTIAVLRSEAPERGDFVLDDFAWRGAFDVGAIDDLVEQARPETIAVRGADAAGVAMQLLGRYQRFVWRRNKASSSTLFEAVLELHAGLYASQRTERDHALDTWQWMIRLDPSVGLAAQIAALFHEVDRLDGTFEERIEHRAHHPNDRSRPDRGRGSVLASLRNLGVSEDDVAIVLALVVGTEASSPEAATLDDADALSFLSLMSPHYGDHFGVAQTRRKLMFTLERLSETARSKLAAIRLRPDLERLLASVAGRGSVAGR